MMLPNDSTRVCEACQTELSPSLLSCPLCGRLVHANRLKALSSDAERAFQSSDSERALSILNEMLTLLPENSSQYKAIREQIVSGSASVGPRIKASPAPTRAAGWGVVGIALVSMAGKGKLLLLGLTKMSTLLSMLASIGVYWTLYGWRFAVGLVVSIYIHEMGHVAMLRRYGIKADAPLFIPGLGAFVRSKQAFDNPRQNAEVGLAGPFSGLVVAIIAYVVSMAMHWPSWAAIAHVGAWMNLFNLVPLRPLDGSRGFDGLPKPDRWIFLALVLGVWFVAKEGLLLLILAVGVYRAFKESEPVARDPKIFFQYLFLLTTLTGLSAISPQHVR